MAKYEFGQRREMLKEEKRTTCLENSAKKCTGCGEGRNCEKPIV